MKVPVCWLKDYVEFEDSIEGLADKLTFCGIEVEGIETIGADIPGVVVGQAIAIEQHPNADKLRLVTVEYGAEAPIQIVCGAPNVVVGGKYPFAPEGTTLPGGFTLTKAKIRGVESRGMLCAKDELGLGDVIAVCGNSIWIWRQVRQFNLCLAILKLFSNLKSRRIVLTV